MIRSKCRLGLVRCLETRGRVSPLGGRVISDGIGDGGFNQGREGGVWRDLELAGRVDVTSLQAQPEKLSPWLVIVRLWLTDTADSWYSKTRDVAQGWSLI
jgi:hypothetical protein